MLRRRHVLTTLAVLFLAGPLVSALAAQDNARDSVTSAAPAGRTPGAPIAPAGVTQSRSPIEAAARTAAPLMVSSPPETSHSQAEMIVGGAALLVGAIVGGKAGTVVMIGGAAVGLLGLWHYLQ